MTNVQEKETVYSTSDYTSIVNVCNKARNHRLMIGVTGDTGMGKTTALEVYSRKRNVFYIAYDKTMNPKQFFISLLKIMGVSYDGSIHQMVNRVVEEINSLSKPLIIIDEAGKITHTMILYLHVLRDKTISNCGIVLAGMPYFRSNLLKFSNKQKEGYAEFYRRINVWHTLTGLSKSEIFHILDTSGIGDETIKKEMQNKRRFADLVNEIILYKTANDY